MRKETFGAEEGGIIASRDRAQLSARGGEGGVRVRRVGGFCYLPIYLSASADAGSKGDIPDPGSCIPSQTGSEGPQLQGWVDLGAGPKELRPDLTLTSGQAFTWRKQVRLDTHSQNPARLCRHLTRELHLA